MDVVQFQFDFKKGKGTRNAFFILRMVTETAIEKQKDVFYLFCRLLEGFWQSTL